MSKRILRLLALPVVAIVHGALLLVPQRFREKATPHHRHIGHS